MTDKQIIIEDCPYFIGGNCQEYLDGVCENHKCDLKIIRELEQKLKAKEQECNNNKIAYQMEVDIFNQECLNLQGELKETLEQLDQLKAENDELKKKVYKYEQAEKYPAAFLWQEGLL